MSCYSVNARNRAESTEQSESRFLPPRVEFFFVGFPRAGRVFEWAITQTIVRDEPVGSLTSYRPVVHICSHYIQRARSPPPHAVRESAARLRTRRCRSLNILTVREPMGLSSRCRLLLLASCQCVENARIRAESLEKSIFSLFLLGWFPRWSWSITRGLKLSAAQSVDQYDNICETFGGNKIAVSLWIVVSVPCSETDPNLRHHGFSSIVAFSILKVWKHILKQLYTESLKQKKSENNLPGWNIVKIEFCQVESVDHCVMKVHHFAEQNGFIHILNSILLPYR